MNLKLDFVVPALLASSSITFIVLYLTLSINAGYYANVIRIFGICLALVSCGVVFPPVQTFRRRLLKIILYTFFTLYLCSYTITTFAYIFNNQDDGIVYIDLLFGCLNLPLFFLLATRVKGYEEEHVPILEYPNITVTTHEYFYEQS